MHKIDTVNKNKKRKQFDLLLPMTGYRFGVPSHSKSTPLPFPPRIGIGARIPARTIQKALRP